MKYKKLVLIVGNWNYEIYEFSIYKSLFKLGYHPIKYSNNFFFNNILGRLELKFSFNGILTLLFNYHLIKFIKKKNIDLVLMWRPIKVLPKTILILKKKYNCKIISYNNDDFDIKNNDKNYIPFFYKNYWNIYKKSILHYDYNFVSRKKNLSYLKKYHLRGELINFWYDKDIHKKVSLDTEDLKKYSCDLVFIGHYENDGRIEFINEIIKNGFNLKIWGTNWEKSPLNRNADFRNIRPVKGIEYSKALTGAKICLCFLSKLNNDEITRRCFEIPATGKLLLAERTNSLMKTFKDKHEAFFFSSPKELVEIVNYLLNNDKIIEKVSLNGYYKIKSENYSSDDIAKSFIKRLM